MICKKCNKELSEDNFYLNKKTGYREKSCNACRKEAKAIWKRKMFGKTAKEMGDSMKWKHYEQ